MDKTLRVQSNERVDINDFRFLAGESITSQVRELINQFICNPDTYNRSILSGFEITNPSGTQVQVDKGRAILHQRVNGSVIQSVLTTKGEDSIIIDIATYPNATYNVYIRFDQIPGNSDGRIFWNPTGNGSEYIQTIDTRFTVNWSMRLETSSPGEEWFSIGTVTKPGMAIVDRRNFYFEGAVNKNFESGWSTEGGGASTDRSHDREIYGITDLHTFISAIKQCVEDIKGRGIKRWYEKSVGGMNIAFDTNPTLYRIAIGDDNCYWRYQPGPLGAGVDFKFDNGSNFLYSRSASRLTINHLGNKIASFESDGIHVNDNRRISCCLDDDIPLSSQYILDSIRLLDSDIIYTSGNPNAFVSRVTQQYKELGTNIFFRNQILEGLNVVTGIDHYNGGSFSTSNMVNSIRIEPGVAYINGATIFIKDNGSGGPLTLSDLWNGDINGGLTTEAKTHIGLVANGYENCFCLYVWLRKDGTFWLEPFGPDIDSRMSWKYGGPRVSPQTISGLPQTGFRSDEYLLIDVCWLVHGKASTGASGDIINLSGAIYTGGDYRAFEVSNYIGTEVDGTILNETGLSSGYHYTDLDYANTTGTYQKRSPGIPGAFSRRARISISGSIQLNTTAVANLYVGYGKYTTGASINCDLLFPGTPFHISEENNFGSTININFGDVIDVDSSPYIDNTVSGGGRFRNKIITFLTGSGTYSVNLTLKLLGFYWNRKDVSILSRSIETVS